MKRTGKPITRKVRLTKCSNLIELGLQLNRENWKSVYGAGNVDDEVSVLTSTIAHMLDESLPERTHPFEKPWMRLRIKQKIKTRQRAFTSGDALRYKQLCDDVSKLVSNGKANYYQLEAEGTRETNPAKWYETV